MEIKDLKKDLKRIITSSNRVFIVGHDNLDLDAIGAIIGIDLIVKKFKLESFVIINDNVLENGTKKVIAMNPDLNIISKRKLRRLITSDSILIIVDANSNKLISISDMFDRFKEIVVIDHHSHSNDVIDSDNLYIIDDISSTCELITKLCLELNVKLEPNKANSILAGIVLDTNNFTLKADRKTFYYAYHLLARGATMSDVQLLLKQDLPRFRRNQKLLTNLEIINKNIAVARSEKDDIYSREDLARIADTLLQFNDIDTTFVIGRLNKKEIGISARSSNSSNVGEILSYLNGGGSKTEAATRLMEQDIEKVYQDLINIIM